LDPQHKDELYRLLMEGFGLATVAEAKEKRTSLTSDYRNMHRIATGVAWFDALHDRILEDTYRWAREINLHRPTAHKVFTYLEWKIIEKLLDAGDEVLLMHDGIIFKECNVTRLKAAAAPHKLKIERW
jgi:hypothetical protein